jgi:excisionase family DNA binding protein
MFHDAGARVIAISDVTGAIRNDGGIDPYELQKHVSTYGGVRGYPQAEPIPAADLLKVPCEFLVPAALEKQITAANAWQIEARIIAEGANGPTTPEADDILQEKGIVVVPDVVANAGGVTVSYFEWVQDFNSHFWTEAEINQRLERAMTNALEAATGQPDAAAPPAPVTPAAGAPTQPAPPVVSLPEASKDGKASKDTAGVPAKSLKPEPPEKPEKAVAEWLTPVEAAALLKISESDVLNAINKGEIKAKKIGPVWRIPAKELQ